MIEKELYQMKPMFGCARVIAFSACLVAAGALAQEKASPPAHDHMHMTQKDARSELDFPPPMRQHMLSQMRAHLEALQAILAALGAGNPGKAGDIAEKRLGLGALGAAACDPSRATGGDGMAAMMGAHMPPQMREMGMAMHSSASAFAAVAAKARETGDLKPALAALATVTENCAACHSAFKLR
ncbi:hypothetical protein [Methylosinus sp. Sm6]|uniref:hypothetical protein n=1 Tax=Methylosinus sp. Sm6 TaxID=2866948 RepID=UPI001C995117|nr:hypothetical protein [Methylosinus sp. Sm6]MBY6241576.1 hypothetical protein [Methylosinus sp. Sm6]